MPNYSLFLNSPYKRPIVFKHSPCYGTGLWLLEYRLPHRTHKNSFSIPRQYHHTTHLLSPKDKWLFRDSAPCIIQVWSVLQNLRFWPTTGKKDIDFYFILLLLIKLTSPLKPVILKIAIKTSNSWLHLVPFSYSGADDINCSLCLDCKPLVLPIGIHPVSCPIRKRYCPTWKNFVVPDCCSWIG